MNWKNSKNPLSLKSPFIIFSIFLFFSVFLISGCTSSHTPVKTDVSLVEQDDPLFDKRFEGLSIEDLDLEDFWTGEKHNDQFENVPLTSKTFVDIVEKAKNGVVNIYTRRMEMQETKGISLGSGFIINKHGYILTNAHVIHNATDIRILLSEGKKEYPAKIIGKDMVTDIALIKINTKFGLTTLPLGDSDALQTGEIVLALGNPLGLGHSLTSGLVSAKGRMVPQFKNQALDFIQTDSAINPGSSGGPLLNLHGEVVGINTALLADAQLIGFAIPVNIVKDIMPMLVLGKTERGWFGATVRPLKIKDEVDAGFSGKNGVIIVEVDKKSPAEKAGLQAGDIIVKINDLDIKNFLKLRRKMLNMTPKQNVHLTIFRNGKTFEVSSRLISKPKK